jgi:hypothetical protein
MSKIRVLVSTYRNGDLPVDFIENTVYFDDFNVDPTGGTDWQAFATDVRDAFRDYRLMPGDYGCSAKVYNMADPLPRPVKASAPWMVAFRSSGPGAPREVALCLSYYSERNLPRFRGRLYLGPFNTPSERPNDGAMNEVMSLAPKLGAIGGPDVDWGLWSPTRAAFSKITAGWVDDEWDTVRSRGRKSTKRFTYTTSE